MKCLFFLLFLLCFSILPKAQICFEIDSVIVCAIEESIEENVIEEDFGTGPALAVFLSTNDNIAVRHCYLYFVDENGVRQKRFTSIWCTNCNKNIQVRAELALDSDTILLDGYLNLDHSGFLEIVSQSLVLEIQLTNNQAISIPVDVRGMVKIKNYGCDVYYSFLKNNE